jgi:type II secretory pathway predicted ATPase ExeA
MKRSPPAVVAAAVAETAPQSAPFPYRDYRAAREEILAAFGTGPFYGLLLGASGTGKTSLMREIASALDRRTHQLLYLSAPKVSLLSIARYFASVLRLTPKRSSLETIKLIADQLQAQPTSLVAWIDEAASIPVDTLSELRSLAEFHPEIPQIFSVILAGPPELKAMLDAPALFPLKRRISVRCSLQGLARDELDVFLLHRFGSADQARLPNSLRDELFERARGVPALIDRVASVALRRAQPGPVRDEHLREALDVCTL